MIFGQYNNLVLNLFYVLNIITIKIYLKVFGNRIIDENKLTNIMVFSSPILIGINMVFGIRVTLEMALISYWFFALGLHLFFKDIYKLDLIYALCVFYSEFYEIPIYFLRWWRGAKIMNNSILFVILRLIVIIYVFYELNKYGYNWKVYAKHLIKITFIMVPICWYMLRVPLNGYNLLLFLKLVYFTDLLNYLRSKGENKYVL